MANSFETPQWMQRRARGLLLFWRRELERKLQINWYLPECSRGATLEIMAEMDRRPGDTQELWTSWRLWITLTRTTGIWSPSELNIIKWVPARRAIPQQLPETLPKCLGRDAPLKLESWPPSPALSSTSSDSSGPPTLESLTEL